MHDSYVSLCRFVSRVSLISRYLFNIGYLYELHTSGNYGCPVSHQHLSSKGKGRPRFTPLVSSLSLFLYYSMPSTHHHHYHHPSYLRCHHPSPPPPPAPPPTSATVTTIYLTNTHPPGDHTTYTHHHLRSSAFVTSLPLRYHHRCSPS